MVVKNVVQSKLVFHADMIIGWKMFVCICVYLALPQLGSVPWIPDTSSQRGVGWARFGAGSLAQSGWSAARKPDTTEGRAQGTEHIDQLQTLLLCQCWRKFWYDPLPFWYRGKSTLACVSLNQSQLLYLGPCWDQDAATAPLLNILNQPCSAQILYRLTS